MQPVMILNSSEKNKTVRALTAAAKKAGGKVRAKLQALAEALGHSPTAGRARRSKETSSMAKKHTAKRATPRKATRTRKTRVNPTTSAAAPAAHHFTRRKRSAGTSIASKLKSVNVMGIMTRGACIAGGMIAQSFVSRQSERILPSLPKVAHSAIGSGVVAGAAVLMAGNKGWAQDIAASAVAAGLQGIAREFAPGLFAGDDAEALYVQGYEDGAQYASDSISGYEDSPMVQGLEGLAYAGRRIPEDIATRPASL